MTETLAHGYSFDSTQRELSNEYQHDRVRMIFIIFSFFVHWTKAISAKGLNSAYYILTVSLGSISATVF